MQPKYCRNCTQRLTSENLFKKRLTELPSAIRELIPNSEPFVYFCNEQCFNTCLTNTHNQQQTLTINTSINQSPTIKNEPMDTTSPPCTPNDLNGSPNGRPRRLSLKRRQDNLNKVREKILFFFFFELYFIIYVYSQMVINDGKIFDGNVGIQV
jgi:hypothetical protein